MIKKITPRFVTFRSFAPKAISGRVKPLIANAKGGEEAMRTQATTLMSFVLSGALLLVPATKVNAQVECIGTCEERFVECLRNSGTSQQLSPGCLQSFEICVNECLGNSVAAALFG
jgi:hypothetical protein